MDPRFAAAEAAAKQNRFDEAIGLYQAALSEGPGTLGGYRGLATLLYRLGRFEEASRWAEEGVGKFSKDLDLWNLWGVTLRRQRRFAEAATVLEKALKLGPNSQMTLNNLVNVFNDLGEGKRALEYANRLVRAAPGNAEFHRMTAIAYRHLGEVEKAIARLEMAVRLNPKLLDAWIDRISLVSGMHKHAEALDILEKALKALPDSDRLRETKAIQLRRAGRSADAEAYLRESLAADETQTWAHFQLARTIADRDRKGANDHYRRAVELKPDDVTLRMALAESLDRSRYGDEGAHIQEAYETVVDAMKRGRIVGNHIQFARQIFLRVGAYEDMERVGSFEELGRYWGRTGNHAAFLQHLGRVKTPEHRRELIHQHRLWGDAIEVNARRNPIKRPAKPREGGKVRLGFLSSDLRGHPVAYFALPVFEFADRERFEVYCYSFYQGQEDATQAYIRERSTFRWHKSISDRDAAQMIADDQLDILFELGGSTHMNKPEVMAYRPAPVQASWLGYPHSLGLTSIDYLLVDPYNTPEDPALLIEQPLVMPKTWISLGTSAFRETDLVDPVTPEERNGVITFGTANNPHKYGAEMLRVWARVLQAVPNSRFLFVRPEGGTRAFRENMQAIFASEGVAPERVRFEAVRGRHLPFYNEIDIALDTFPLTGGTTTCETLWMGVPVVSLVGEAFFERLSYSILNNAGLGDLVATNVDDYVATAVRLAADPARRMLLRATLRDELKKSPLGDRQQFARDFYDLIYATVQARLPEARRA